MKNIIDRSKFGPWAIITGASSGIGKEFARQLAGEGFNLVLVARRVLLLNQVGAELSNEFKILYRAIEADLSKEIAIKKIAEETEDLEVGLLISNAGTGNVRKFFSAKDSDHKDILLLNATSHLSLTHHFGKKMLQRNKGGILLTGAMGATDGVPYMANEAGTKAYIQSLGKSLHTELKETGIHITVLITSPTETTVFSKLGFTRENVPMQPLSVEQCVSEALSALSKNKTTVLPGLKFRIMNALVPGSLSRDITGKIMRKNNHII
jgi:short-subunit dehydrogenase